MSEDVSETAHVGAVSSSPTFELEFGQYRLTRGALPRAGIQSEIVRDDGAQTCELSLPNGATD
jgi:hypothetical protein